MQIANMYSNWRGIFPHEMEMATVTNTSTSICKKNEGCTALTLLCWTPSAFRDPSHISPDTIIYTITFTLFPASHVFFCLVAGSSSTTTAPGKSSGRLIECHHLSIGKDQYHIQLSSLSLDKLSWEKWGGRYSYFPRNINFLFSRNSSLLFSIYVQTRLWRAKLLSYAKSYKICILTTFLKRHLKFLHSLIHQNPIGAANLTSGGCSAEKKLKASYLQLNSNQHETKITIIHRVHVVYPRGHLFWVMELTIK